MGRWTQSCCDGCWIVRHGSRVPARLIEPEEERCAFCGETTTSGIYVRADPATVPYPRTS